jgi:lactate permease
MLSPDMAASLPIAAFAAAAWMWPRLPHRAALAGAATAFAAALVFGKAAAAADALWRSVWIAGPMALVIVAGVALRDASPPAIAASRASGVEDARTRHRKLYVACFLLGPFFECAVGFGIGTMLALPFIAAAGWSGARAVALGMLAQSFVPWGALAIGTMASAAIADLPPTALGVAAAESTAFLLPAFLAVFWWLTRDQRVVLAQYAEDALWLAATWGAVRFASEFLAPDIAGLAAIGAVLAVRGFADGGRIDAQLWRRHWPYLVLVPLLVCVRLAAPVADLLTRVAVPTAADLAPFAPFHHAAFWLGLVAIAACLAQGRNVAASIGSAVATARGAMVAGFAFVLFGEMLARPGFAKILVNAAEDAAGPGALLLAPLLAAFGGAMTGSALAANAMALPLTLPLWGADALGGTGLQTAVAAAFTALSPSRVALAVSLVGLTGGLGLAYRALAPLAAALALASLVAFAAERI